MTTISPKARRGEPSLKALAEHWAANYSEVFPDLPAADIGWGEPFCFRCGWLAPTPGRGLGGKWSDAAGWLERAHLHDYMSSRNNEPDNIVPLCMICHRGMPDFPQSRDDAVAWAKAKRHSACPTWWQEFTDSEWGSDNFTTSPGRTEFVNAYVRVSQGREHLTKAANELLAGNYGAARESMRHAGLSDQQATHRITTYLGDLALERSGR